MEVEAAGAGEAAAPSPPPAPLPVPPSPPPPPEVEEARARLVKALHGTLLQSHINAPRAQATAVDALLAMVQARRNAPSSRGPVAASFRPLSPRICDAARPRERMCMVMCADAYPRRADVAQNVVREPGNAKFRRVRCSNEAFKSRIAAVRGGEDFLRAAGWRDATITFERHLVLSDAPHSDECVPSFCAGAARPPRTAC